MHPLYPQAGANKHNTPDQVFYPDDLLNSYHRPPKQRHEAPDKASYLLPCHCGTVSGIKDLIRDFVVVTFGQEYLPCAIAVLE